TLPETGVWLVSIVGEAERWKHSLVDVLSAAGSLAGGRSAGEMAVNVARQQYRPATEIVAASERMGLVVVWSTGIPAAAPTCVPPLLQLPVAIGPQRKNLTVPDHVVGPVTVRLAESFTWTEPPGGIDVGGGLVPSPAFGVVTMLDLHS